MTVKPETIRKHIEINARKKAIYDRHLAGETYVEIARTLGISTGRTRELACHWRGMLEFYSIYLRERETWNFRNRYRNDKRFIPLIAAGLIGKPEDRPVSPEVPSMRLPAVGEALCPIYGYA